MEHRQKFEIRSGRREKKRRYWPIHGKINRIIKRFKGGQES